MHPNPPRKQNARRQTSRIAKGNSSVESGVTRPQIAAAEGVSYGAIFNVVRRASFDWVE